MSKLHILVVDDTPSNLAITEAYLEPFTHAFSLVAVTSGKDALILCSKQHFDLIFLDLEMPELDGFNTAEQLRKHCTTPIIAMSGHTLEHLKQHPLSYYFNGFVGKPFNDHDLLLLIDKHCLSQLAQAAPSTLTPACIPEPNLNSKPKSTLKPKHSVSKQHYHSQPSLLDVAAMLTRLNHNKKLAARLLKSFSQNNLGTYDNFQQAVDAQQWQAAARIAHTLKGGGANLGANALSALGAELETLCTQHTAPAPTQMQALEIVLTNTIARAQKECAQLEYQLQAITQACGTHSNPVAHDRHAIKDELEVVLQNLHCNVGAAQDKLDDIERNSPNDQDIQQMVALFNQFALDKLSKKIEGYLRAHQ